MIKLIMLRSLWISLIVFTLSCTASKHFGENECNPNSIPDSVYFNYLKVLRKYELSQQIQKKYDGENILLFYFRSKSGNSISGGKLLVFDSSFNLTEASSLPSCCDSSVLQQKRPLDSKTVKKINGVDLSSLIGNSSGFYECRKPDIHELFEVVFTMQRGKITSGILVEGECFIKEFDKSDHTLFLMRKILL